MVDEEVVIPLIRALWKQRSLRERKLSLVVSGISLFARVARADDDAWGWEFTYGGLSTSGYGATQLEAVQSAEACAMLALKKPKSNWREAKVG